MPLVSNLFSDSRELEDCLVLDRAHVVQGTKGYHVRLIQTALVRLGFGGIDGEASSLRYGLILTL